MQLFAIKHVRSGTYMPVRMRKNATSGCWSSWHPGGAPAPFDANPRLFFDISSARMALSMWRKGEWLRDHYEVSFVHQDEMAIVSFKLVPL